MIDDRSIEGAEFVLGLLDPQEARAVRLRIGSEPTFARDVARWRGRLAGLADEIEPAPPPAGLWERIDQSIGSPQQGDSNVVVLHRRVSRWRALTGGMTALAASLGLMLVVNRQAPIPAPAPQPSAAAEPMVAMIKAGTQVAAVASWDKSARRLIVSEVEMPVVPHRSYELWVIPRDGKPRSVGVMPDAPHMRVRLEEPLSVMLSEGSTLAVSLEPLGGSPTGAPTGKVVASGALASA